MPNSCGSIQHPSMVPRARLIIQFSAARPTHGDEEQRNLLEPMPTTATARRGDAAVGAAPEVWRGAGRGPAGAGPAAAAPPLPRTASPTRKPRRSGAAAKARGAAAARAACGSDHARAPATITCVAVEKVTGAWPAPTWRLEASNWLLTGRAAPPETQTWGAQPGPCSPRHAFTAG